MGRERAYSSLLFPQNHRNILPTTILAVNQNIFIVYHQYFQTWICCKHNKEVTKMIDVYSWSMKVYLNDFSFFFFFCKKKFGSAL